MNYENIKLKQYFIGGLNEAETEEIDLQIISGELSEENLLIAENGLIEDFIEKNLSSADLLLFHRNFFISKEREAQILQTALLKNYAETNINSENTVEKDSENKNGFFWDFATLPSFFPFRIACGFVIIGIFIGIFWFAVHRNSGNKKFSSLENEYAAINNSNLSDLEKFLNISKVSLVSGSFRSAENLSNFSQKDLTDKVLIRLALPNGVDFSKSFQVEFKSSEKIIFTQVIDHIYQNPNGEEFRLFVPSKIFQKGIYQVSVNSSTANETKINYNFSID